MGKSLLIVESPTKVETLKKIIGKNFIEKASVGHIKDLPKKKLGVDVENNFNPEYITIRGKGKVLSEHTCVSASSVHVPSHSHPCPIAGSVSLDSSTSHCARLGMNAAER